MSDRLVYRCLPRSGASQPQNLRLSSIGGEDAAFKDDGERRAVQIVNL